MSVFTSEEASRKLADFGIILKHMPFLQEHGFSEFGKGQLTGKMELLREGLSDSTTNHSGQQFDSHMPNSNVCPSSYHDYEVQDLRMSSETSIETSPNLEHAMSKRRNFTEGETGPGGSKASERAVGFSTLEQNRGKNYLSENNKWNFKNDDESSWINRIRKLADM